LVTHQLAQQLRRDRDSLWGARSLHTLGGDRDGLSSLGPLSILLEAYLTR